MLGYGYICNTHVRVDLIRENLSFRKKAWIELIGLTFFLIPYCAIVIYFASVYAYNSFMIGEISASQVGLTHRWIIKSILVVRSRRRGDLGHRGLAAGRDRALGARRTSASR